jgi:chromosome segregation ATPase
MMGLAVKQVLSWRHNKNKIKKKIENLSNEWEQLSQYLMLLEQSYFHETLNYNKMYSDLQAKQVQLNHLKDSYADIKNILTEIISIEEVKPKEFQTVTNEMLEVICELNRVQVEKARSQENFEEIHGDRDEKVSKYEQKIEETKNRMAQIETELGSLRLSS